MLFEKRSLGAGGEQHISRPKIRPSATLARTSLRAASSFRLLDSRPPEGKPINFWRSLMDDTGCREFFLDPTETYHRQYEALRAFFVEGRQLSEIAQQFGYQESSLSVMISNFRNQVKANNLRPFLFSRGSDGRKSSPIL